MKSFSAFRSTLPLLLLALIPAACAVGSDDTTTPDDSNAPHVQSLTDRLQPDSITPVEVLEQTGRGVARVAMGRFAVEGLGVRAAAPAGEKALAFLDRHGDVFGPRDAARELAMIADTTDELGKHHVTFGQTYEGIEVYNSSIKVHLSADGDHVEYVSSDFVPGIRLSTTTPALDEDQAIDAARGRSRSDRATAAPKLFIYGGSDDALSSPRLVWVVDLTSEQSVETTRYFVDAESGSIVDHVSLTPTLRARQLDDASQGDDELLGQRQPELDLDSVDPDSDSPKPKHAKAASVYVSRLTYDALNKSQLPGTLACQNGVCNGPSLVAAALDANVATTMATFAAYFGRNSYKDGTSIVQSSVKYKGPEGPNAFWDGGNTRFAYSAGLGELDVVAHEYTHAVTQYSANLTYSGESGALNESFSDIFGTYINSKKQGKDVWTIGATLPASFKGPCGALRDISDPPSCGTAGSPAPKTTANWVSMCKDNRGVHYNAGIVAYAYYKLASAIGKDRAAKIFYRALTRHLSAGSKLEDARTAVWQSADDLYCTHSLPAGTVCKKDGLPKAVRDYVSPAFAAAGLDGSWKAPALSCTAGGNESALPGVAPNPATYKGCYTDKWLQDPRALPHELIHFDATVDTCTYAAKQAGYHYAGLQYGGECWAGTQAGYVKVSDSECTMKCDADSSETCGGALRNSIWYVP